MRPSRMRVRHALVLVLLGAFSLGATCKKKLTGAGDGGADAGGADAGRGLANTHNDKETVALAKDAAACPREKNETAHFRALLDPECPAMKAWEKSDHLSKNPDDDTLFNMIEDEDTTTRWLGATALIHVHERWSKDKPSALRVLAATEAEKNKYAGYKLGLATAMIDLKATKLADRVVALIRDTSRDPWLRGGVMATMGYNERPGPPEIREAIEGVARKDDDTFLRGSAIRELWFHADAKECALFLELAHDPAGEVASSAVHGCLAKACADDVDPMLDEIERRAKGGEVNDSTFAWALGEVGKSTPPPPPAKRKRLVAIAQEIVKNDANGGLARSRAIESMVELDPAAAKAFASKYTKDSDSLVASAAKKAVPGAK